MFEATEYDYLQQFRGAIQRVLADYLIRHPQLERANLQEFQQIKAVFALAADQKMAATALWVKLNNWQQNLLRPWYRLYKNELGDIIKNVLMRYSYQQLSACNDQMQRNTHLEVTQHQTEQIEELGQRIVDLKTACQQQIDKLNGLQAENAWLKEEKAHLQEMLEKQLAEYAETKAAYEEKMTALLEAKEELFEKTFAQENSNADLSEQLQQALQKIDEMEKQSVAYKEYAEKLLQEKQQLTEEVLRMKQCNQTLLEENKQLTELHKQLKRADWQSQQLSRKNENNLPLQSPQPEERRYAFFSP